MNVSSVTNNYKSRIQAYMDYANSFMNFKAEPENVNVTEPEIAPSKKSDKSMGIETLTIFPKQVIDGKTIITA